MIDADGLVVGRLGRFHRHQTARQASADLHARMSTVATTSSSINADKVVFTGNKRNDKTYYRHTGYPGGIKERQAHQILDGRFPERVLEMAVRRMLPDGPLGRQQVRNLKSLRRARNTLTRRKSPRPSMSRR